MQHSWLVVDSREAAMKESGDVILSKVNMLILNSYGEVVVCCESYKCCVIYIG